MTYSSTFFFRGGFGRGGFGRGRGRGGRDWDDRGGRGGRRNNRYVNIDR